MRYEWEVAGGGNDRSDKSGENCSAYLWAANNLYWSGGPKYAPPESSEPVSLINRKDSEKRERMCGQLALELQQS